MKSSLRGISKWGSLASLVITGLIVIIVIMYFDDYFESSRTVFVSKKIENDFFTAEISIINRDRGYGVAPNNELIYYATYDIKSEDVLWLNPIIEIEFREKPTKSFTLTDWMITQDGLRWYREPILIDDLGFTVITYGTKYHVPNSFVTIEHERKEFVVKTISELEQEKIEKAGTDAFTVTAIIGSITAIAILGTFFIARINSKLLEEQKNIMKENSEKQIAHLDTENQLSEKHIEYLGMLEIMRYFNDPRIAKERDTIIRAYRNNSLYDKVGGFRRKDLGEMVASVRGTFDQMGKLVLDKYVDEEQFYNMYADSVIVMYKILKKHIDTERTKRQSNFLAHNFESIFNQAKDYWKAKFPNEKEPEPF